MPSKIPTHRPSVPKVSRHKDYDQFARDPQAKAFYDSAAWQSVRLSKLRRDPLCGRCLANGLTVAANTVHHKVELSKDRSLALDLDNLESLCPSCHSAHHRKSHAP